MEAAVRFKNRQVRSYSPMQRQTSRETNFRSINFINAKKEKDVKHNNPDLQIIAKKIVRDVKFDSNSGREQPIKFQLNGENNGLQNPVSPCNKDFYNPDLKI